MTAITKPQLQAQLDEALERIAELEAAQAEALALAETAQGEARVENNLLEQSVWLSRNAPCQSWSRGFTKAGEPYIRFGAQYSARDEQGNRTFGGWKNYVAYGDVARQVEALYSGSDRLVHMVCFESPSHGTGERVNERYTEWVVKEFRPVARLDAATPAPAPAPEPELEPSLEELPF